MIQFNAVYVSQLFMGFKVSCLLLLCQYFCFLNFLNLYFLDIRRIVFFFFTKHYIKARSSESRRKPTMTRYLPCYKAAKVWNVAGHAGPTANGIHRPNLSLQPPFSAVPTFFIRAKGANYCCGTFYIFSAMLLLSVVCSFCSCLFGLPAQGYLSDLFSPPPPPSPTPTWPSPIDISVLPSQYLLLSLPLTHTKCLASDLFSPPPPHPPLPLGQVQ